MNNQSDKNATNSDKSKEHQSFLSCTASNNATNQDTKQANSIESLGLSFPCKAANRPYILGIDPGINGAIAILDTRGSIKIVDIFDMPTVEKTVKGKIRKRLDVLKLALKIDAISPLISVALIEEVGQVGTQADPFSSFIFGFSTGAVHGVLKTCLIPVQTIKPNVWKASLGLSSDKNLSIEKALKLIPESKPFIFLKKHDGRAEALLLAYIANKLKGENA